MFINLPGSQHAMPKTDSFYLRAEVDIASTAAWDTTEIPIGAFVDALGEVVLRIHEVRVKYQTTGTNGPPVPVGTAAASSYISYTLTTQEPGATDIVTLDDKSLIASGQLQIAYGQGGPFDNNNNFLVINSHSDVTPEDWDDDGYLVGVDQLYLNGWQDAEMGTGNTVSIVMRCTSEKLTKGAAMALALSQQ
jgi:hypothetical protein